MQVLKVESQIAGARAELVRMGVSFTESRLLYALRQLRLLRTPPVGDVVKSWDVLSSIQFIESNLRKDDSILDIGCYASEVIVALHKRGFTNLAGADLDSRISRMPFSNEIRYEVCDFMHTPFEDASFKAITSISVIEHGFNGPALLSEISRLLKPSGYFISSFDYWPEKIDTSDTNFFGMDWKIFSKQDVTEFTELASTYGLVPVGDLNFESANPVIHCGGKDYTFGWLVLQKRS